MLNFILQAGINTVNSVAATDSLSSVNAGIQAANTVAQPEMTQTEIKLMDMVMLGGPVMVILGFLFALSIYVLVERLMIISKDSKKNATLLTSLKETINT